LGEFAEVGDAVKEFASNDATVVVGTVIDESLTDELRVTVVATGLDAAAGEKPAAPVTKVVVDNTMRKNGVPDYAALDRPPALRRHATATSRPNVQGPLDDSEMEYLDIPAFLRRQAD